MKAREEALKILLRKRQSGKQILDKLLAKGFEESQAQEAVSYYKEMGYIDDGDFAKRFAADAIKLKGHGRSRIIRRKNEIALIKIFRLINSIISCYSPCILFCWAIRQTVLIQCNAIAAVCWI